MVALRAATIRDLPQFVEHINGINFKLGLRGTIRMETPVVYFYSPHDVTVSAKVSFSRGLNTEWYPHADRAEPAGVLTNASLGRIGEAAGLHIADLDLDNCMIYVRRGV